MVSTNYHKGFHYPHLSNNNLFNYLNSSGLKKICKEAKLYLLAKRKIFGRIVGIPEIVKPVLYVWIFAQKSN